MSLQVAVTHVAGSTLVGTAQRLSRQTVRFGRHPDNDVVFDPKKDVAVSSFHAEMFHQNGQWLLRDLNSRNGTYLDAKRIEGTLPVHEGAIIRFGEAGPQVLVSFGEKQPAAGSAFVGQHTLVQAIDQVVEREREVSRKRLIVLVAVAVAACLVVAVGIWIGQASLTGTSDQIAKRVEQTSDLLQQPNELIEKELQPITDRIQELQRKHAAAESEFERLTLSIREQQNKMADIQSRADLSESVRQQLLTEAESQLVDLTSRLDQTQSVLRSTMREPDWPSIVEPYLEAVFLCYYDNGTTYGIGTAFAIDGDGILATNAHVATVMRRNKLQLMIQNGTGRIFLVEDIRIHPKYDGTANCPDLALVRVKTEDQPFPVVEPATAEDFEKLKIGSQLGTLGFPGELLERYSQGIDLKKMRCSTAVATFKDGWVGQVTDFSLKATNPENSVFIQHSASVSHGTSGSPLFNPQGRVVAINNSGRDIEFLASREEQGQKQLARSSHPAEISRAIRIDVLQQFREEIGW